MNTKQGDPISYWPPTSLAHSRRAVSAPRHASISAGSAFGSKWILVVLVLTVFEGAIRKWLVPGFPTVRYAVYFSKDVAFVCAALAGLAYAGTSLRLLGMLCMASLVALLIPTLVNLSDTSGVGAVLSLRAYVVLPFCAFIAAHSIRSLREFDWIVFTTGVSTIVVAILGAAQFELPANHFLNVYEGMDEYTHISAEFNHVRATGTFAFITGMAIMSGVGAWAGLYLFLSTHALWRRLFGATVILAGLCCALVSMSRGGIFLNLLTVAGGLILFRRVREMFFLLIIGLVAYWLTGGGSTAEESLDPGMQGAVLRRFEQRDSVTDRFGYVLMNLQLGLTKDPLGRGLGRGQIGGNFAESGVRSWSAGYESELGRIGFEVGILGFFGVILWRVAAIVQMARSLFRTENPRARALIAASLPLFSLLAMNFMAFNHTGSSFGWAIVALALGAAALAKQTSATSDLGARRQAPLLAKARF
jgi:hypothetical protein